MKLLALSGNGCRGLPIGLIVLSVLLSLPGTASADCLGDAHAKSTWTIHVVPQLPPATLYTQWSQLLDRVGKASGQCFELRIERTIPEFEQVLLKGDTDFAFLNPYHLVMARARQGYEPLLTDSSSLLTGILVVKADNPITHIKQLDGAKIAFPAPNAFAASLLLRALLAERGIRIEPIFVKSHSNVYRAVVVGDAVAGGAVNHTLMREPQELRDQLRVLFTTPGFAPHPLAAHPRVPVAVREAVSEAVLNLSQDESGRRLLKDAQLTRPIKADYDRDYRPLEKLGLEKFVVIGGE